MSRKNQAEKRDILPDRKYNSVLAAKFINNLMQRGKKSIAEGIFYDAFDIIQTKIKDVEPVEVFNQAIEN
ncbi:30S ribosomal protein S7, partial [bacterium]|nr:30S ribosomal protein S7 [bacterium]